MINARYEQARREGRQLSIKERLELDKLAERQLDIISGGPLRRNALVIYLFIYDKKEVEKR
jgi:translation initiation factor RLI1